jgi:hypothetical protein
MAALILVVGLGLMLAYWLMTPLITLLSPVVELHALPWLLALLGLWLLAGRAADSR